MAGLSTRKFGRYRLIATIGDGAMARLFLAVMTGADGFKRVVVLKQVLPHLTTSSEFIQMFLNEAQLAARLDHPNIVRIYELGQMEGDHFISMEYLPAEDLTRVLHRAHEKKSPIPITVAATIAQNVADALATSHDLRDESGQSLGLVHRDVSLSNILVSYHGITKLGDFGIAKATAAASELSTRVGVFKGKYAYAAPEQVLGQAVDARTDIFALGIVLWELLAVRRLFKRANEAATVAAVEKAEVPSLRSIRPDVPPELEAIALKALARSPEERFQTAAEMSEALEQILGKVSARASSTLLRNWMVELFGEQRADLKRAIAQGRGFDVNPNDEDDLSLSPESASLLGVHPLPDTLRNMHSSPPPQNNGPSGRPRKSGSGVRPGSVQSSNGIYVSSSGVRSSSGQRMSSSGSQSRSGQYAPQAESTAVTTIAPRTQWSTVPSLSEPSLSQESSFGSISRASVPITPPKPAPANPLGRSILVGSISAAVIVAAGGAYAYFNRAEAVDRAELALVSDPPAAAIAIDGLPTGLTTPAAIPNLPVDRAVKVVITKEGFAAQELSVQLRSGHNEKSVALGRLGSVRFGAIPPGTFLIVDNKTVGPHDLVQLRAGPHEVRLERNGEVLLTRQVEVKQGDQTIQFDELSSK